MNQKLFNLYGATALFGLIGFASVVYTAWNIHFMKIFSPKAKEVMMDVYGLNGYGGMVIVVRAYPLRKPPEVRHRSSGLVGAD